MDENKKKEPVAAPGSKEFIEAKATPEEIKKGNYTKVITFSWEEGGPSWKPEE